jgi:hypothetical protein
MRVFSQGPAGRLGAALLPVPAALGQAYQSWGPVSGGPGVAVPAPGPGAVPQSYPFQALHKSSQAPDMIRPGQYYQTRLPAPPDVSVFSDNQMPVPALVPGRTPAIMAKHPVFLGQQQIGQPLVSTWYQWRNTQ